jgi:hypothetical protein
VEVVVDRAAWLVRRYVAATLLLAMAAGLAGGLAMTAWLSARRAGNAVDRFNSFADPAELSVTFCPPGSTGLEDDEVDVFSCYAYPPATELPRLRALPEVQAAGRFAYQPIEIRGPNGPAGFEPGMVLATGDPDVTSPDGAPIVLAGRLADPNAPDEAIINTAAAEIGRVGLGDRFTVRWPAPDETGLDAGFSGPERTLEIVGIVRTPSDLSAAVQGSDSSARIDVGPGVWRSIEGRASLGYTAIAVQARDSDGPAARAAILAAFAHREFAVDTMVAPDDVEPVREAFGYDAKAAYAFSILVGLAGVIFVGQAVARQMRREWADLPVFRAIGLSRRQTGAAAALRGLAIALPAGVVAAGVTLALSPTTPFGSARVARVDHGVHADPVVLGVGTALVAVIVSLVVWLPVWRLAGPRSLKATRETVLLGPARRLPPPATAGLGMAVNGGRGGNGLPMGTALAGTTLAVTVLISALAVGASLHHLVGHPPRFGAPWDASLRTNNPLGLGDLAEEVAAVPGVSAASLLYGNGLFIDGDSTWTIAFDALPGTTGIEPVITAGRAPAGPGEIAVGALTQRRIGKHVGDSVELTSAMSTEAPVEATIVGTVVMNAVDEGSTGLGAIVTPERLFGMVPEESGDAIVIDVAESEQGRRALSVIEQDLAVDGVVEFERPVRPTAVRNVERVRNLPYALALVVVLFAAAGLAHALVLSVHRNRSQLGVLRALGFNRRQVAGTVASEASALSLVAIVIGIPLGIAVGRWGWRTVADRLGLVSPTVVPVLATVGAAALLLVVANVVAAAPAGRATRDRPAEALRAE